MIWQRHNKVAMLQGGKRLSRMTLGEKEQEFLEALSVRYHT